MTPELRRRDHARLVGERIRMVRTQQGLSLADVEKKSAGKIKTVVIGSYERGDRMVTVERLAEIAEFFGVPVSVFLAGAETLTTPRPRIVLNLVALHSAPPEADALRRWATLICRIRGDWNGLVLSVRISDMVHIAAVLSTTPGGALDLMNEWGVLHDIPKLADLEIELGNAIGWKR
ncbi:transcriptional regulator [Frankia sp. Mgl5]|uniref:transcriptional regulator n=1 Tax=Frankia sp. Mgl5 TaxID=2933793 RepID=UPI00201097FF|nr:transcriptional regulator [Frankia sp. Mgl5]MCK9928774.1 transcriptional regulator [Frankia sp. Mgl5]